MKKTISATLFIFGVVVIAILVAGLLFYQKNNPGLPISNAQQPTGGNQSTPSATASFDVATVAKHNTASDCWLIINQKVYDVTSFIPNHSGGEQAIISYCGQDATVAFDTKGGRGQHSPRAQAMLGNYYIGELK